jgi:hypothetical protein
MHRALDTQADYARPGARPGSHTHTQLNPVKKMLLCASEYAVVADCVMSTILAFVKHAEVSNPTATKKKQTSRSEALTHKAYTYLVVASQHRRVQAERSSAVENTSCRT